MIPGISHIFIICDEKYEPERYQALKKWLSVFPQEYYSFELYCWGTTVTKEDLAQYGIVGPSQSEASLIINHYKIFEKFCKEYNENDRILILESDVIPVGSWVETLTIQMKKLEMKEWDFFQLGNGCGFTPVRFGYTLFGNDVYLCPQTRCTDSIVWTRKCADAILKYNKKIELPIDHFLNKLINELSLKVYWGHPFVFVQGSQNGVYQTTIDHK